MKVHSVWHVPYLRAYKSDGCRPYPLPGMNDGELEIEVDRILNHRTRTWGNRMLTDLCMCCKCLQLRNKIWIYCEANSCSHYLILQPHCLPDLLQPEHHLCFILSVSVSSLSQDSDSPVLVSQTSQTAMPLSPSMIAQSRYISNRKGKPLQLFPSTPCSSHQYAGRQRTADSLHWSITDSAIALQT